MVQYGFGPLSHALMQHGQHGAEVLAGLMHGVFDPLVESIFHYGGKIVGFAGDGIMALYPIESDIKSTALRALVSAYVVQERLAADPARQTPYGVFPISVKIGLSRGTVSWGILLSEDREDATYYFRGTAVDDSATAEHFARPGDILLSAEMAELLQGQIRTTPHTSYERLAGFQVKIPDPTPIGFPPVDLEISRHFMPEKQYNHQEIELKWNERWNADPDIQALVAEVNGSLVGGSNPVAYIDQQVAAFGEDFAALVDSLRGRVPGARLVVLNVPNVGALPLLAGSPLVHRQAAQRASVGITTTVINRAASDSVRIVDVMCDARLYSRSNLFSDGFHPNDAGSAIMAEAVWAVMEAECLASE